MQISPRKTKSMWYSYGMHIALGDISFDPRVQLRTRLNEDRVQGMIEFETEGGTLPPVTIVGDENLLADGHHRFEAANRMGRLDIEANKLTGGFAEAIAEAIRNNDIATSAPLTRTERNRGILELLDAGWKQRKIAQVAGVGQSTVIDVDQIRKARQATGLTQDEVADDRLRRISSAAPGREAEVVQAANDTGINDAQLRAAMKAAKDEGVDPVEAVRRVATITPLPTATYDAVDDLQGVIASFWSQPFAGGTIEAAVRAVIANRDSKEVGVMADAIERALIAMGNKALDLAAEFSAENAVVVAS